MDRHAWWKWLLLLALVAFSLWLTIPPQKKVRLGLDIRGGSSFVVKVDEDQLRKEIQMRSRDLTPEQVENEVRRIMADAQSRALEVLRGRVDRLGTTEPIIYAAADNRIVIQLPGADEKEREYAKTNIQSVAFLEFRMVHERNDQLVRDLFDKGLAPEGYTIVNVGNESYYRRDPSAARKPDAEQAERLARFRIPDAAHEFMLQEVVKDGMKLYRPYFVKIRHELTGENLKSARVDYRTLGQPVVAIEFDARGARKFANLTSDYAPGGAKNPNPNEYRQLAIVLDGKLYSAPVIREPIYGGKAEISGSFSEAEAYFLANILSAGALPAPVKIVETRFVAPSLGSDAVRSGVRAALYGAIAVFLFMMLYYRLSGVVADVALLLNVLLLPLGLVTVSGFLGIFAKEGGGGGVVRLPVMTLPGLAGIALTIGMAVDANILIFERIREELVTGKRLWSAIVAGYNRAFSAIFDSNITTILSAVVLFLFGAGPIRG
ncbi:MAG: protein translocase subunit SecD, partial [Kiritimatiellia bacterium]